MQVAILLKLPAKMGRNAFLKSTAAMTYQNVAMAVTNKTAVVIGRAGLIGHHVQIVLKNAFAIRSWKESQVGPVPPGNNVTDSQTRRDSAPAVTRSNVVKLIF